MEKSEKVANINFFKKVWYSITKFEQYPVMAVEGFWSAMKYTAILMSILSVFVVIGSLVQTKELINDLAQYIEQNIPEFSFEDGKIEMDIQNPIEIKDVQYDGIDKIIINPIVETEEQKEQFEKENEETGITVFFFRDEISLKSKIDDDNISKQKYTYNDFIASYTGENISSFNKADLVKYLTSTKMTQVYIKYGVSIFVYLLLINIIYILFDVLQIAIFGWLTAYIAKIKIKFVAIYNMATYAFTLPIILNMLYIIVNYFVSFKITYFEVAYTAIAYIYLAATIFILKDDIIKKMQEVEKIKEEQKKVKEEIKNQEKKEEEPKDENEKKEEKNNKGDEPQGSEA